MRCLECREAARLEGVAVWNEGGLLRTYWVGSLGAEARMELSWVLSHHAVTATPQPSQLHTRL